MRRVLKKLLEKILGLSIFTKTLGIALILIILFGFSTIFITRNLLYKTLTNQTDEAGVSIAKDVSGHLADLIITKNLFSIHKVLRETIENYTDIKYLIVIDPQGEVINHTFEYPISSELINANIVKEKESRIEFLKTEEGLIRDIAVPLLNGKLGTVRIGLSEIRLRKIIKQASERIIFFTLLIVLGISIIGYFIIFILYKPVTDLITAVNKVSQGNFKIRVEPRFNDDMGKLTQSFNVMVNNLEHTQDELEKKEQIRIQLMQKIISSQEDERNRIARELHDSIGQLLTSLKLGMKAIEPDILPEGGRKKIEKFRILLDASLEDIHNLAVELRPPLLSDFGLFKAIENYSKEFENNFDIAVHYKIIKLNESYRLPSPVEVGLYRVIQEALTNIAKHANATEVNIIFEKTGSNLFLSITDNGKGFESETIISKTERKSLGIFGMQERIFILGGNLKIDSKPGKGSKIAIDIPLKTS